MGKPNASKSGVLSKIGMPILAPIIAIYFGEGVGTQGQFNDPSLYIFERLHRKLLKNTGAWHRVYTLAWYNSCHAGALVGIEFKKQNIFLYCLSCLKQPEIWRSPHYHLHSFCNPIIIIDCPSRWSFHFLQYFECWNRTIMLTLVTVANMKFFSTTNFECWNRTIMLTLVTVANMKFFSTTNSST